MKKGFSLLLCAPMLSLGAAFAEGFTVGDVFSHLASTYWYTYIILLLLVGFAVVLLKSGGKTKWDARSLSHAALCVALAYILSCIRLYRFSFGGSITLFSMLPILLFALAHGPAKGVLTGIAYGLLQLIQDFYVSHPIQLLLDYPLAFGALGLAGLAALLPMKKQVQLPVAVVIGTLGRYLIHVISGAVFFGAYAAPGQTALAYSIIYNAGYMLPDAALCLILAVLPVSMQLLKIMERK